MNGLDEYQIFGIIGLAVSAGVIWGLFWAIGWKFLKLI